MTYPEPCMEVTIVNAETVRCYARQTLPPQDNTLVEEILLDDDRARALVEEETVDAPALLSGRARKKAKEALSACSEAVACYELLAKSGSAPTVRQFASSRFSKRWALLDEIRNALPAQDRNVIQTVTISTAEKSEPDATKTAFEQATAQDAHLVSRLYDAFWEKASPLWKAQIAKRIAEIHDDKSRIRWLTSAFA